LQNRELTILKELSHPNVVTLYYFFYTKGDEPGSDYLHLVMEFFNSNLARLIRHHRDKRSQIPMVQVKCLMYQMLRGLNYLHYQEIGHRDIKPHNLLLDPNASVLKVCDFGCAKKLLANDNSISYICSRYYRPPELCMGATQYGVPIGKY
jgi:glycogen synthase kinase 3 beta